jgi:hypothetical protein
MAKKSEPLYEAAYYNDDPYGFIHAPKRRRIPAILSALLLLVVGTLFVQTTLAANISLSSRPVEFGQGITQPVACSGATNLNITPNATFTNASGAGAFYFSSLTVSNIPIGCYGEDFTIRAYGNTSSTPLALFNTTSTSAVVYNDNGTFKLGIGSTGASITRSAGTFTFTFDSPVALASTVMKITVESGEHREMFSIGGTGPGGGTIFYYSAAGFNCGPAFSATGSPTGEKCNYLEAAPSGWNGGIDPSKFWAIASKDSTDVSNVTNDDPAYFNQLGIGLGYKNSVEIVNQGNGSTTAAGAARAYTGGSKNDWYLPTSVELNLLCQWAGGVAPNVTTMCSGGVINSNTYGAGSAGLRSGGYWSSSEATPVESWVADLVSAGYGFQFYVPKSNTNYVRPIRAF